MAGKSENNELGPFQKGIDFFLHFRGRRFTLDDIKDRYDCTYRQACRIRNQAARILNLKPAGFEQRDKANRLRFWWEIEER